MSLSPNSSLVRRTIDLNYDNKQRSASLKWIVINGLLFVLFTYDLWRACPGYTGALHYVEACLCAVLCANVLSHALRLRPRPAAPRAVLSRDQLRLLGLRDEDLDSSFHIVSDSPPRPASPLADSSAAAEVASLSPTRSWRGGGASPPRAHPSPPAAPPSPPSPAAVRDQFISDSSDLDRYLRECELADSEWPAGGACAWAPYPGGAPAYRVSAPAARAAPAPAPAGSGTVAGGAHVWRRLHLDPHQISQFDLNLRRWLHATVVERVARELAACDAALAAAGQEARAGAASPSRLAAAGAHSPAAAARLQALLPFLRPFADQKYAVARVRELARSSCLSAFRWDAGGPDWDARRPTDAELLMHLFATYLDSVLPGGEEGGAFSSRHVTCAPAPVPRGPHALALHRAERAPPHYLLVLGDDTVEVSRGRNNLMHTLLLFIAAVARGEPPALRRLHLGPAGLNVLWVLGR